MVSARGSPSAGIAGPATVQQRKQGVRDKSVEKLVAVRVRNDVLRFLGGIGAKNSRALWCMPVDDP
jgi:hypothetical protein